MKANANYFRDSIERHSILLIDDWCCVVFRHLHDLCEWGAKEGLNRLRTILKVQYMCNCVLEPITADVQIHHTNFKSVVIL